VAASQGSLRSLERAWWSRGALARALLPVSWVFGAIVALRRTLYRIGILHSRAVPVPVVVVGNLIVGGAGKTPTVIAIVELLREHGFRPGIISRGYGRRDETLLDVQSHMDASAAGDEPLLMRIRLGVPVVVGRDRVAAAHELLRLHPEVNLIVSDDGLQHLRLQRDAQVIVFDERGAGNGWLLPAGPLREPLHERPPAHTLVLYNAARATTALAGRTAHRSLGRALSLRDWWAGTDGSRRDLRSLAGSTVLAAAGTAHPARFFDMLATVGLAVTPVPLPDHFDYASLPWPDGSTVIVTEKDAVKLRPERIGASQVWVVPLDFGLDADFAHDLLALLPPSSARNSHGHPTA